MLRLCGSFDTHVASTNQLVVWMLVLTSFLLWLLCRASCLPDFIYSEYLTTLRRFEFRQLVWQIAQDYSAAALLLRLPGYVPMPAFTAIEDVPLVVRHSRKPPAQVGVF